MASTSSLSEEEDYCCAVCRDIFKDPVVLFCSHSFCDACVQEWWRGKGARECPVCKEIHPTWNPPRILALKNLCEAFTRERHQRASKRRRTSSGSDLDLCGLHGEELKRFCLGCEQLACVVCLDSKKHTDHSFKSADGAALQHKEKVQKSLKTLQEKLKDFIQVKHENDRTANHYTEQVQDTETEIGERFRQLRQFLREEEEASFTALREEEQRNVQEMTRKMEVLNKDILSLSNVIRDIEEELKAENISFLKTYKTTMERVQQHTLQQLALDHQPVSKPRIDEYEHLHSLVSRVSNKMKSLLVLDHRHYMSGILGSQTWDGIPTSQ